jgi:NSS family neurotransmitter:Na+ symporter
MAPLFYLLLSVAALTSLMSLHEVCTAFLHEDFHLSRTKAATIVTAVCCIIGTFCSLSFYNADLSLFGMSLFDLFDFVTGQIFLPVVGFLTCILIGWFVPHRLVHDEFTNSGTLRVTHLFHVYIFLIKYVCPICILWIFLHQLGLI